MNLNAGFLGTAAPRYADVILIVELAMGLALIVGAFLARQQKYRAHAACQSTVIVLNLFAIILFMLPSFRGKVAPKIPSKLGISYYGLATAHGVLGTIGEAAAIYIVIGAGTKWLPERFRLQHYKFWMRSVLVLWWIVLILGVFTYARWYIPHFLRH